MMKTSLLGPLGWLIVALLPLCIQSYSFNTGNVSFIKYVPNWTETGTQAVRVRFRTVRANVMLMSHSLIAMNGPLPYYAMYVMLRNGELEVLHKYNDYEEVLQLGKGLNYDKWHDVTVTKDPLSGNLNVELDKERKSTILRSYQVAGARVFLGSQAATSQVLFGDLETPSSFVTVESFVGCIENIKFSSSVSDLLRYVDYRSRQGVRDGCINLCDNNPCQSGGVCVNEYTDRFCDCLGTGREGKYCNKDGVTTMTLRGFEWVTYDIYSSYERSHLPVTRITLEFKTFHANGILLYGGNPYPIHNHIAVSLYNGTIYVSVAFGDSEVSAYVGRNLNDDQWHNLSIIHQEKDISVRLDLIPPSLLKARGKLHHLYLNPTVFVGGGERFKNIRDPGLKSKLPFVGCIRNIFFNHYSILELLKAEAQQATYHGGIGPVFRCESPRHVSMSFIQNSSQLTIHTHPSNEISVQFDFRTTGMRGVLFHTEFRTDKYFFRGYLQISLSDSRIYVEFVPVRKTPGLSTTMYVGQNFSDAVWHNLKFRYYSKGVADIEVDRVKQMMTSKMQRPFIQTEGDFHFGYAPIAHQVGFIGCIRGLIVQDRAIDPRKIVGTSKANEILLDGCSLSDHCQNDSRCEHNAVCIGDWFKTFCVCPSGYEGKTCHFAKYKRSCDEYYQAGDIMNGVHLIDVDGNGPLEPKYVMCQMGVDKFGTRTGLTSIEHNLGPRSKVRAAGMFNLKKVISYRELTDHMLNKLIRVSGNCEQSIDYKCNRAPLRLGRETWFTSITGVHFSGLGSPNNQHCGCADNHTCSSGYFTCNCDRGLSEDFMDGGVYKDKKQLPIKEMYFIQNGDGTGTITLGSLQCYGRVDELENALTFGENASPLELPGWASGDLTFWFRTNKDKAVLLHQMSPDGKYFEIRLTNSNTIIFNFTTNLRYHTVNVISPQTLNSSGWQYVAVEYDTLQMRLTVNLQKEWVDLLEDRGEYVLQFDKGPLYLGGTGGNQSDVNLNFMGCMQGLNYNREVQNMTKFLRKGVDKNILAGCTTSCNPNPCRYGSVCSELWTKHKCSCKNPKTMFGDNCEININEDAVSFVRNGAFMLFREPYRENYLMQNVVISFRTYRRDGLVFYMYDHLNNFIQLYVKDDTNLVFMYNSGIRIVTRIIPMYPGISNGAWRQFSVYQTQTELKLTLDDKTFVFHVQRIGLVAYSQAPFFDKETVQPPRGRVMESSNVQLYLGSVPSSFTTSVPSFNGCVRGFKIGEKIFKLGDQSSGTTGVKKDCISGCDYKPCMNGGVCVERWEGKHVCNCSTTSYRGPSCTSVPKQPEVAATFDGQTQVSFDLDNNDWDGEYASTESISLAFSTSHNFIQHQEHVLAFLHEGGRGLTRYISFAVTGYRSVAAQVYFGKEVFKIEIKGVYDDGFRHTLKYHRQSDKVTLKVDNKTVKRVIDKGPFKFSPTQLIIGGFSTVRGQTYINIHSGLHQNFSGCISNVHYQGGNPTAPSIFPLDAAFGLIEGMKSRTTLSGRLVKAVCAAFFIPVIPVITTKPPFIDQSYTFPPWPVGPADTVEYGGGPKGANIGEVMTASTSTILIVISLVVIMIIMAVVIAIILCRVQKRKRKKKEQKAYEKIEMQNAPPKPDRFVYRENGTIPRLKPATSRASDIDYPSSYRGSPASTRASTLPTHRSNRSLNPSLNRSLNPSLNRSLNPGISTQSGLFVPNSATPMTGSQLSMLSQRSRLASMEDLTADELDSPTPPRKRKQLTPNSEHYDEEFTDMPLINPETTEIKAPKPQRPPSSISEVIEEMNKLTSNLPRDDPFYSNSLKLRSDNEPEWEPDTSEESPLVPQCRRLPSYDRDTGHNTSTGSDGNVAGADSFMEDSQTNDSQPSSPRRPLLDSCSSSSHDSGVENHKEERDWNPPLKPSTMYMYDKSGAVIGIMEDTML
ncbi:axotactin-like isoform X2 [Lineus longissimus]|uniref:axotactin-like isoform X2 n=1 Tax=Lineus longissimus TaxID=88925 RepID=UPI00315E0243